MLTPIEDLPKRLPLWSREEYETLKATGTVPDRSPAAIEAALEKIAEVEDWEAFLADKVTDEIRARIVAGDLTDRTEYASYYGVSSYISGGPRSGAPWTPEEEEYLKDFSIDDATLAKTLGRTAGAIRSRRAKVDIRPSEGIKEPWTVLEETLGGIEPIPGLQSLKERKEAMEEFLQVTIAQISAFKSAITRGITYEELEYFRKVDVLKGLVTEFETPRAGVRWTYAEEAYLDKDFSTRELAAALGRSIGSIIARSAKRPLVKSTAVSSCSEGVWG